MQPCDFFSALVAFAESDLASSVEGGGTTADGNAGLATEDDGPPATVAEIAETLGAALASLPGCEGGSALIQPDGFVALSELVAWSGKRMACVKEADVRKLPDNLAYGGRFTVKEDANGGLLVALTSRLTPPNPMAAQRAVEPQCYDYLLVLDFEATCDDPVQTLPQEIIEFPIQMVNLTTLETEATFHFFTKPRINPKLSEFCTELTGITQDIIDAAPDLGEIVALADHWLETNRLGLEPAGGMRSFLPLICGDWDLNHLRRECLFKGIEAPRWARTYCNVKYAYEAAMGTRKLGMPRMLEGLNFELEGHHHSGIDDSANIAKIAVDLVWRGVQLLPTTVAPDGHPPWHGPNNEEAGITPMDFRSSMLQSSSTIC